MKTPRQAARALAGLMAMAARVGVGVVAVGFLVGLAIPAHADERQTGPMTPLASELLAKPIRLTGSCSGVVIREWHGDRSKKAIKLLDILCRGAVAAFPGFLQEQGLKPVRPEKLSWNVALLPDGHCYRCLNDREHRFAARTLLGDLWGYTNRADQYVFLTNEIFDYSGTPKPIWVESVVHELWHAMSQSSGVYYQNWGDEEIDEQYARKFVGYVLGV